MVASVRALAAVPFSKRCHWQVVGLVMVLRTVLLGLGGAVFAAPPQIPATRGEAVDFARDVLPILEERCHACHGPALETASLRLDSRELAMKGGDSGLVIIPRKSVKSLLIQRLTDSKLGIRMPPTGALPEREIVTLRAWIDQGAQWPDETESSRPPEHRRVSAMGVKLFAAIRASDLEAVNRILDTGANLASRDEAGDTPLMHAALYAGEACLRMLLDHGADPNQANDQGATPLMWAAGDYEKVRILLHAGAEVDARSDLGRTALFIAARKAGTAKIVKELLGKGADSNARDRQGATPLMEAARAADPETLQRLLAHGADVNARRNNGRTALMAAARSRSLECVRLLLTHGAEVNTQAGKGVSSNSEDTVLTMAASRAAPEILRALLEKGADVEARNARGYTALMQAAYSDFADVESVKLLLEYGANINVRGKDGETALSLGKKRGETPIVRLLLDSGARGSE